MINGRALFFRGTLLFVLVLIAGSFAVYEMLGKAGGKGGPADGFFEISLLMVPLTLVAIGAYIYFVKYLRFHRVDSQIKDKLFMALSLICLLALTLMIAAFLLLLAVGLFT